MKIKMTLTEEGREDIQMGMPLNLLVCDFSDYVEENVVGDSRSVKSWDYDGFELEITTHE